MGDERLHAKFGNGDGLPIREAMLGGHHKAQVVRVNHS